MHQNRITCINISVACQVRLRKRFCEISGDFVGVEFVEIRK